MAEEVATLGCLSENIEIRQKLAKPSQTRKDFIFDLRKYSMKRHLPQFFKDISLERISTRRTSNQSLKEMRKIFFCLAYNKKSSHPHQKL